MRRLSTRNLGTLLIVTVLSLFLLGACTGPSGDDGTKGDQGQKGDAGAKGDRGDQGAKGDTGATGVQGAAGSEGEQGHDGEQGPAGPTIPAAIVLVPVGETSALQPLSVETGSRSPKMEIYGSGFPAGDLVFGEIVVPEGSAMPLQRRGGEAVASGAGTFRIEVRLGNRATLAAGLYTIRVTGMSGVEASALLIIADPKA